MDEVIIPVYERMDAPMPCRPTWNVGVWPQAKGTRRLALLPPGWKWFVDDNTVVWLKTPEGNLLEADRQIGSYMGKCAIWRNDNGRNEIIELKILE